ncbi:G1 family glutamic endopeptidase [Tengunoibacter tsumagoiensis]|uniref:Uncharacterized protein n=1 Tax=Tengunoibacter tsumagoiensis TaxID=2014871 RepID=A0A402A6L5_9CHLR|nr:G1 family glutamic endopeptidase [Tengunoibacter tsumagoiensis]GCE14787.1 hypothetical protein KTT_46460 [Tengunoibacter tsumagoiensis]
MFMVILSMLLFFPQSHARSFTEPCLQVPEGSDPSHFSPQQLSQYGLPPYRPGENYAQWVFILRSAHTRSCQSIPGNTKHMAMPLTSSINWAGGLAVGSQGYSFATASWRVPCLTQTGLPGSSSTWVGLGGLNNTNLVQTGTEQDYSILTGKPTVTYKAWVENLADPSNPFARFVFSVNCTDQMVASVTANATMFIEDLTTGTYATQTFGPAADTRSADFILERGYNTPLPTLQPVVFHNCQVRSISTQLLTPLTKQPHERIQMRGLTGTLLADATEVGSGGNITITWKQNLA